MENFYYPEEMKKNNSRLLTQIFFKLNRIFIKLAQQREFVRVQSIFVLLQNLFAGVNRVLAGVQSSFAAVQSSFVGVQSVFAGVQRGFAGVQSVFAEVQSPYVGVQNAIAGVQNSKDFRKPYYILLILVFLSLKNYSQILPLDSILNRIERNNPMLKMYDEQINAAMNYAEMTKSWMPPKISAGPWQLPYSATNDIMIMITGEQMIPNPAKQKANYNYMHGMSSVETQGKGIKKNELFAQAKKNYFEWIVLKKKYDISVQTDSLLNYIFHVSKLRYIYNKERLSSIYKAEADLYELRNMETMFMGDMAMKNAELNTLINAEKTFIFSVDTTYLLRSYDAQLADTSMISASRSDIKQYEASIGLIHLQQEYERSKRLPEFGFSFSHMQSLGPMGNSYSAMGMVTLPFVPWASKEYKSNIKGMQNTANSIQLQKQSVLNETSGMITSLQAQMKSAKQQMTNYSENIIPSYYKSYQASMLAYEQNTEELFVVLDGLKMYRMAKLNELDKLNTLLNLQVDYEKEMEIR